MSDTEQTQYERESTDPRNRYRFVFVGQSRRPSSVSPLSVAYGAGEDEAEARHNYRQAGGLLSWPHSVVHLPEHICYRGVAADGVHTVNLSMLPGSPYPQLGDSEVYEEHRSGARNNTTKGIQP